MYVLLACVLLSWSPDFLSSFRYESWTSPLESLTSSFLSSKSCAESFEISENAPRELRGPYFSVESPAITENMLPESTEDHILEFWRPLERKEAVRRATWSPNKEAESHDPLAVRSDYELPRSYESLRPGFDRTAAELRRSYYQSNVWGRGGPLKKH